MNTPWFSEMIAWLPGTLLGCVAGMLGGLTGFAFSSDERRAKWLPLARRICLALLCYSGALLLSGLTALVTHQPYGVWYALLYPGALGILGLTAGPLVFSPRPNAKKA